jgi:hypothetical protein
MKKVLLSLAVVAALGMTSCGSDSKEGDSKEGGSISDMDKMCECITKMMELENNLDDEDDFDGNFEAIEKVAKECETLAEKMAEGKSDEELKKMEEEFVKSCDAYN